MITTSKFNKILSFNYNQFRKLSTYQSKKIFDSIEKSKNILPKLNFLEQLIKNISIIISAPFGFCTIKQNHIVPYFTYGKFDGYRTCGLRWIPPISEKRLIFCGDISLTHTQMNLTDSSSNPIIVSSYVIYNIINPVNHIINLNSDNILSNWIENIVREIISTYSYNELTSNKKENLTIEEIEQIIKAF